jgi:hypothetical protein
MKDMTIGHFCRKFDACKEGREWAYKQLPKKSNAMMSELWPLIKSRPSDLKWVATRDGVFSDKNLRLMACRFIREIKVTGDKTLWDLMTDERSRNAVIIAERFANGEATSEELATAAYAAYAAAYDYAAYATAYDYAAYATAAYAAYAAATAAYADVIMSYGNPFLTEEQKQ